MFNSRLLGIILFVTSAYALYDSSSDVVELTSNNFDRLVTKSDEIWIVEFYAPWCGHCKNLVPEYKKAARALKGIAKVGAVDADQYKDFIQKQGVQGFPTIKVFTGSKSTLYSGQRTAEGLVEAALKAAKEKAYDNLGKKPSGSSSDKHKVKRKLYGHFVPWKKVQTTQEIKQVATPYNTSPIKRIRFKALQQHLFRKRLSDDDIPKIIKTR